MALPCWLEFLPLRSRPPAVAATPGRSSSAAEGGSSMAAVARASTPEGQLEHHGEADRPLKALVDRRPSSLLLRRRPEP